MKKYNLSSIMKKAREIFRKEAKKAAISFGEALRRAWASVKAQPINEKRIADAKAKNGISEEIHTWADWYKLGFEVIHEQTRLFMVELIYASKGDGKTYKASFFGKSQVKSIA